MNTWLTEELKTDIRKVFEPRYKRELSNEEVIEIANNLVKFTGHIVKFTERSLLNGRDK